VDHQPGVFKEFGEQARILAGLRNVDWRQSRTACS
jgi:hypothetical protein